MFKKILAYVFGLPAALRFVSAKVFSQLGRDILTISPQERGERITAIVKKVVALKYPQYAAYEGIVIDEVAKLVRQALAHK